jgi:hypothetical protein
MAFRAFTEPQWAAIRAVRPRWPANNVRWRVVRRKLERAGHHYWMMHCQRLKRLPPKRKRDALPADDPKLFLYEVWTSKYFQRRADEHRELLYLRVMNVWTGQLGGKLAFSRGPDNQPRYSLVQFMTMALRPILGRKTPRPTGLADIIDKERRRRAKLPGKNPKT